MQPLNQMKIARILSRPIFRFLPVLLCIGMIFYLSSIPSGILVNGSKTLVDQLDEAKYIRVGNSYLVINQWKTGHFVGYAGLGAILLFGFSRIAHRPELWAIITAALVALADEFRQLFTPGRHGGLEDFLLDIGAAGLAVLLMGRVLLPFMQKKAPSVSQLKRALVKAYSSWKASLFRVDK